MPEVQPATVVLVEDDGVSRTAIEQLLKVKGYAVAAFDAVPPALDWLQQHPADCVISDLVMEGMTG
jgi:CheY-like chemotaxis protein